MWTCFSTYLTGSFGGPSVINILRSRSRDHPEARDVADRAAPLAVGRPHGLDARADAELLEVLPHDVRERRVGTVELDEHEGERLRARVEMRNRPVHPGHRRDDADGLHLHPCAARRAVDLGVAEGWDDDPLARDALAPDPLLFLEPGEEAPDHLARRVLVRELGDDALLERLRAHVCTIAPIRASVSTHSFTRSYMISRTGRTEFIRPTISPTGVPTSSFAPDDSTCA